MNHSVFGIVQVAEMVGISRDTIRDYERRGWVSPRRAWNGYRVFTKSDITKLAQIKNGVFHPAKGGAENQGKDVK